MKLKSTPFESLLREAVQICYDEFTKIAKSKKSPHEPNIASTNTPNLIPVNKWNNYHDFPKPGGLRGLIFHADSNGFDKCIRRVGRSVLIHEEEFFKWVESHK